MIFNFSENVDLLILGQEKNSQTERLEFFFKKKFNKIIVIAFSSIFKKNGKILLTKYTNQKLTFSNEYTIKYLNNVNEIFIIINFFRLFIKIINLLKKKKINMAIGIALFSSTICFYLKIKGSLNKYIYYCLDYYNSNNKIINKLYVLITRILDKIVTFYSYKIWSISYRLAKIRKFSCINKSLIVPNGCANNIIRNKYNILSKKIVFVGTISHNHALAQLLEVLRKLNETLGVNLEIIGSGPYENKIKTQIAELNLKNIVKLHGFIKSDNKVNKIVQNAAICYCVWTNSIDDNSSLADPGKPKLYTSLNRPMIISDNVYISKFIRKFNAGIVIKPTTNDIFNSLDKFFRSKKYRKSILKNIHIIKKMWNSNKILNRAYNNINIK